MSHGKLEFHPAGGLRVGQEDAYRFVFTVCERDLGAGAVLTIAFGHGTTLSSWTPPQTVDPLAPGFSTVSSSGDARLELSVSVVGVKRPTPSGESRRLNFTFHGRKSMYQFTIRVAEGSVKCGERIIVTYGDGPAKARAPLFVPEDHEVICGVDPEGTGEWTPVSAPTIPIAPGEAARLKLAAPSTFAGDRYGSLVIAAFDEFGNLVSDYRGELELRSSIGFSGLPERVRMESGGYVRVPFGAPDSGGGPSYIVATDRSLDISGWSNPIVLSRIDGKHILWGEIHAHTHLSDGERSTDGLYTYARDVMGLDFAGQGDHIDCFTRAEDKNGWLAIQDACKKYYQPGKFATLLGFEANMTRRTPHVTDSDKKVPSLFGSFDHYDLNIYFPGDEADIPFPAYPTLYTDEMLGFYEATECVKIVHHSASSFQGIAWKHLDFEPDLVEICSKWGVSEYFGNPSPVVTQQEGRFVQDALAAGMKLGFTGGSDSHTARPGGGVEEPWNFLTYRQGGLTAVFAEEPNRGAIYEALKRRRCYATTGARIILDFKIDGASMGQEITTHTPRSISVDVHGEAPIESIEVIKNNRLFAAMMGRHWANKVKSEKLVMADDEPPSGEDFYYVRVTQVDGHRAWSSPIWVREPD